MKRPASHASFCCAGSTKHDGFHLDPKEDRISFQVQLAKDPATEATSASKALATAFLRNYADVFVCGSISHTGLLIRLMQDAYTTD